MITKCKSDIVTCLRNKGIEPEVRMSSNFNPDRSDIYNAKFGIDYIKSSTSYYVHTSNKNQNEWWDIDFKKPVILSGYRIKARDFCRWIYKWRTELSFNGENWTEMESYTGYTLESTIYNISFQYPVRMFKIVGSNDVCSGYGTGYLAFINIKFFGDIIDMGCSYKNQNTNINSSPYILFILIAFN